MKSKKYVIAFIFLHAFIVGACSYIPPCQVISSEQAISTRDTAREALATLFSAYSSGVRGVFEGSIANDFAPDKYAFLSQVEESMYKERVLETHFFIHTVNQSKDITAISCRWEKKSVLVNASSPVLKTGNADFVFRVSEKEWRLIKIRGNNPFAV